MPTVTRTSFSAKVVETFHCAPGKKSSLLYDATAPGLGLRVSRAGTRCYFFEARIDSQKSPIRMTIGNIDDWPLADAQRRARELRRLTDIGQDPRTVEAEQRERREAEALASRRALVTFGEAWGLYVEKRIEGRCSVLHCRAHKELAYPGGEPWKRGEGIRKAGPLAGFLHRKLSDLKPTDVAEWLERETKSRPAASALAFRLLRAFCNWCVEQEDYAGLLQPGLCQLKSVREKVPRPRARTDCLQREQLKPLFEGLRIHSNQVQSAYLQATLLTGARRNEMARLRWANIDFRWKEMVIGDKMNKIRRIPLTPYVASLLQALPRDSEFVFSDSSSKRGFIAEPRFALNKAVKAAGLPHLTIQGLRRSFGTLSEWVECPVGVTAQIMGHAPSALAEKHYRRRPIDMLRMYHEKIERWILHEAGIEAPPAAADYNDDQHMQAEAIRPS
ncbi:tyrosine-type recombinase/integrase [Burkholderia pseudomallei]|uniref:tyrosine-type recombinase/integrase n=1 Tax=Burkholderia pseudomallei TaxID=28450 RepID=UPI00168AA5DB|nr:integrase family protein [Burkholderia pseudomallei]MBD2956671.1 integrase family protein [Burkholderia pseudomallei]MBD2974906.1 integrase family protein [Burkholderia pseudomallei]MBF3693477.1 integrase family protein [Burkholderia pseudomallei]